MPKKIITERSLPQVLRELDRWEGKLTWPLFCEHMAKILRVESISRHTMFQYPTIKERFAQRQLDLRNSAKDQPRDFTLESARRRVVELEAQVRRLEETNNLLLEKFRRWQYNAYAHNVPMDQLEAPLPAVNRSGH